MLLYHQLNITKAFSIFWKKKEEEKNVYIMYCNCLWPLDIWAIFFSIIINLGEFDQISKNKSGRSMV